MMPNSTNRPLRVFLCHSSGDKPVVRQLYHRLDTECWIDTWLDEEKLLPGQDWDYEIEKALDNSDVVIVTLSSGSVSKEGYVQRELRFVLEIALEKPEGTIFVIPLRLDDCLIPRRLRTWHYVDYFPKGHRNIAYQRLLKSLKFRATHLGISMINLSQREIGDDAEEVPDRPRSATPNLEVKQQQEYRSHLAVPPCSANIPGAKTSSTPAALDAKLTVLQGVGPSKAVSLAKLGLYTLS